MPDQDRTLVRTQIRDFPGLNTNTDPHDLKPGETVSQKNCAAGVKGTLRTRNGLLPQTFTGGNSATGGGVLITVAYPFQTPKADLILYQRTDGIVVYGSDPA